MSYTPTEVNNLIINKLTQEQYDAIDNPSETELYLVPDDTELVTSISSSSTDAQYPSALCMYNALTAKQDAITNVVTGSSQSYTIWSGNQTDYDAIDTKDSNTIYLITES